MRTVDEARTYRVPEPHVTVVSPGLYDELAADGWDMRWYVPSRTISRRTWEALYGPRYPATVPAVTEGPVLIEHILAAAIRATP